MSRPPRRFVLAAVLLNLAFALCHPSAPLVTQPFLRGLAVAVVIFVAPGWPWARAFLPGVSARSPLPAFSLSIASTWLVLYALRFLGVAPEAGLVWNASWAVCAAGLLVAARRGAAVESNASPVRQAGAAVFVVAAGLLFTGATRVVPEMDDHDFELQGTVHALVTRQEPRHLTTRGTNYYFAHPPLLHLLVAESFLFHGDWRELRAYDPAADPGAVHDPDVLFERYVERPFLVETRVPNVFLAALTVARLFAWAYGSGLGLGFSLLLAAGYAGSAEVFGRSCYGGYFSLGTFALLELGLAVDADTRAKWSSSLGRAGAFAGAWAALADHKTVFAPLALALVLFAAEGGPLGERLHRALRPAVVGWLAGLFAFWAWATAISPRDFWMDHVRHHLLDRIVHRAAWIQDLSAYPGRLELWIEFARDTGWVLLPLAAAAFVLVHRRGSPERNESSAFWLAWTLLAFAAFTWVDWRQTKHLVLAIVPLVLAIGAAARTSPAARRAMAASLALLLACEALALAGLVRDFAALVKRPEW